MSFKIYQHVATAVKADCGSVKICLSFAPSHIPFTPRSLRRPAGEAALFLLSPWHVEARAPPAVKLPGTPCYVKCLPAIKRLGHWPQSHSQPGAFACRDPTLVLAPWDSILFLPVGQSYQQNVELTWAPEPLIGTRIISQLLGY